MHNYLGSPPTEPSMKRWNTLKTANWHFDEGYNADWFCRKHLKYEADWRIHIVVWDSDVSIAGSWIWAGPGWDNDEEGTAKQEAWFGSTWVEDVIRWCVKADTHGQLAEMNWVQQVMCEWSPLLWRVLVEERVQRRVKVNLQRLVAEVAVKSLATTEARGGPGAGANVVTVDADMEMVDWRRGSLSCDVGWMADGAREDIKLHSVSRYYASQFFGYIGQGISFTVLSLAYLSSQMNIILSWMVRISSSTRWGGKVEKTRKFFVSRYYASPDLSI